MSKQQASPLLLSPRFAVHSIPFGHRPQIDSPPSLITSSTRYSNPSSTKMRCPLAHFPRNSTNTFIDISIVVSTFQATNSSQSYVQERLRRCWNTLGNSRSISLSSIKIRNDLFAKDQTLVGLEMKSSWNSSSSSDQRQIKSQSKVHLDSLKSCSPPQSRVKHYPDSKFFPSRPHSPISKILSIPLTTLPSSTALLSRLSSSIFVVFPVPSNLPRNPSPNTTSLPSLPTRSLSKVPSARVLSARTLSLVSIEFNNSLSTILPIRVLFFQPFSLKSFIQRRSRVSAWDV